MRSLQLVINKYGLLLAQLDIFTDIIAQMLALYTLSRVAFQSVGCSTIMNFFQQQVKMMYMSNLN